jgi:hypothetical protein
MSGSESQFGPMKMKGCKGCRWWDTSEQHHNDTEPGAVLGGDCGHEKLSSGPQCVPVDGAMDGECATGIHTGPNFCCIHWEDEQGNRIAGVDA